MITLAVGTLNVLLGLVYTSYGVMTWLDLRRGWRGRGPSHFGLAWLLMAFTCGPHHLEHGLHLLVTSRDGGVLDLVAVLAGLPAGATWFWLRVEAARGGCGDRPIASLPAWVESLPTLALVYTTALLTATMVTLQASPVAFDPRGWANVGLVVVYLATGAVLLRTQLANHRLTGGWSLSGLALTLIFPTCALMHGTYLLYTATGRYAIDDHLFVIDAFGVPAGAYFLWVVWSLASGRITDWNRGAGDAAGRQRDPEPVTARG